MSDKNLQYALFFQLHDSKLFDGRKYQHKPQNDKIKLTLLMWESQEQNRVGGRRQLAIPKYSDFVTANVIQILAGREGEVKRSCPGPPVLVGFRQPCRCFHAGQFLGLFYHPLKVLPAFLAHRSEVCNLQLRWQMKKAVRCYPDRWCRNISCIYS